MIMYTGHWPAWGYGTMERQLFECSGWDDLDTGIFQYYNVFLKRKVGKFSSGEAFELAVMDYQSGILTLQRAGEEWKFKLTLEISDEL